MGRFLAGAVLLWAGAAIDASAQPYSSSVVGTAFDFIVEDDPSAFLCLETRGRAVREMPDKTSDAALRQPALVFVAHFTDGTGVDIAIDTDFETESAARAEALRYVHPLGKLPTALRQGVERLVVHRGGADASAFSDVGLIVIYSANATRRIGTHDLEETIFHESVHAAWDKPHRDSAGWRAAQRSDGRFVTDYARGKPDREDLAESALFAYTLLHHPGRIPPVDTEEIRAAIPARIAFVARLLPPDQPIFHEVGPRADCGGAEKTGRGG